MLQNMFGTHRGYLTHSVKYHRKQQVTQITVIKQGLGLLANSVATDDRFIIDHQSLLPLVTNDRKDFFLFISRLIGKFYLRNIFFSRFIFIGK